MAHTDLTIRTEPRKRNPGVHARFDAVLLTGRQRLVTLLREPEPFRRIRVLTSRVMSTPLHVLVEVPRRPEVLPGPEEIPHPLELLPGHQIPETVRPRFEMFRMPRAEAGLAAYPATYLQGKVFGGAVPPP